jgi:ATP-dependent Clp protease ATP-binding subunit ClpA
VFERFTDEARRAVVAAQDEARELHAGRIEPVHLLLALARDPGRGGAALRAVGADRAELRAGLARSGGALDVDALAAVGIDLERVRTAAEAAFGPGALERANTEPAGHIPFADGSKRALEESLRSVLAQKGRRRDRAIDSGALLTGLLAVGDPLVTRVLRQVGTDATAVRTRLATSTDAA